MLKKIPSNKLKTGMYLHKVCGSWVKNPFWQGSFLLEDPKDISKILSSTIKEVIIDTAKGLDVDAPNVKKPQEEKAAAPIETKKELTASEKTAEWKRAKAICLESREAVESMFQDVRLGKVVDINSAGPLVDEVALASKYCLDSVINMARIKTSDNYTYMHSVAVCAMMITLARELGLSEQDVNQAGISGLMHDLGKSMMPLEVLNKPGKLTDDEFATMKTHPAEGYKLLQTSDQIGPEILDVVLHHHEKFDGSGYPKGLQGEAISLFSRMAAVCDVYDAVTSTRPYKDGWEPAHSLKQMISWKGHFDPTILQAFIKSIGIYPVGSLVKLESGRLGIVIEQTTGKLLTPIVKVFFSTRPKAPISIEEIDLSSARCKDSIVSIEDASKWKFKNLNELWMPN